MKEAIDWGFEILGLACPQKTPFFPIFMDIAGRRVVVVGGGKVAARRVKTLLTCGAGVTVISPSFNPIFEELDFMAVERLSRSYAKGDLQGSILAVAATNDRNVNREVGREAKELGIPVSVADAPEECAFLFPALVEKDGIAAAISTGGSSPSLCRRLADRLRAVWPDWIGEEIKKGTP